MSGVRRETQEAIVHQTILDTRDHGLRPHEVDTAVANGMAIIDSTPNLNWGQIASAAIAVTKKQS